MTHLDHLTNDLLVRAIDDELPESSAALVRSHLSGCAECSRQYQEFLTLSSGLESLLFEARAGAAYSERESLKQRLEPSDGEKAASKGPEKVLRRFGWAMAIAATLAIGVTLAPRNRSASKSNAVTATSQVSSSFEVDGETFVPLPYSNADLPLSGPQIVQMRVPASSLTSAGIPYGAVQSEASVGDGSVLADVLLGTDGQPLGVHLIEYE
jgi:anti-sigma factor RsiW